MSSCAFCAFLKLQAQCLNSVQAVKRNFSCHHFVHPPKISPHSHSGTSPFSFVTGARSVSIPCPLFSALILQEQQICFTSKCQWFFHNCIQCQQKTQTPYSHCIVIVNLCIGMLTEIWVFPRQQELAQLLIVTIYS